MTGRVLFAAVLSFLILNIAAHAQVVDVNETTLGAQGFSSVTTVGAGSFVVVWDSPYSAGTDSDDYSVQARRVGLTVTTSSEFQVNSYTTGFQANAQVSGAADGSFVVAWESPSFTDPIAGIQVQLFSGPAASVGPQIQANTYTTGSQTQVDVARSPDGRFVVTWRSEGSPGTDSMGTSIQARRFDALGNPLANQFQVNTVTEGDQRRPSVGMAGDGSFVIVWEEDYETKGGGPNTWVRGKQYEPDGTSGPTFILGIGEQPVVDRNASGEFVVAFRSLPGGGGGPVTRGTPTGSRILATPFDQAGYYFYPPLTVATSPSVLLSQPEVAVGAQGGFVVAWENGDAGTVEAARFRASPFVPVRGLSELVWTRVGDPFTVSPTPGSRPSVAIDGVGDFVVSWDEYPAPVRGGDREVKLFGFSPVFDNGFETGDVSGWSTSTP